MNNIISEKEILNIIKQVLTENRKVIKLPNQNPIPNPSPMDANMGDMNGENMPMNNEMGGNDMEMMDDNMDDNSLDMGEEGNQFDTNFDAGVDADEDSDPKRYIQQLTGKLSQSLNSYNSDNGEDPGLSKYVASMIIAATCKNLDDKAKKELIEKIKSAQSKNLDDNELDDTDTDTDDIDDANDISQDEMGEEPMLESVFTKKQLMEMVSGESLTNPDNERPLEQKKITKCPKAWKSKFK